MPISISRGFVALVILPKFGELITPEGGHQLIVLKALVMLANRLTFVRVPPVRPPAGASPKKNALEILKLKLRTFGRSPLLRGTPGGRSLIIESRLSSLPVVML